MKRTLLSVLSLLLCLCMLLCACSQEPTNDDNNKPQGPGTPNVTADPFLKTENYVPADVFAQMKTYFESTESGFSLYDREKLPFVSTDVFALSNCSVKSITIPVFSTRTTDKNGDFTFSLYIVPNSWAALRSHLTDLDDPIEIKINAEEYELEENQLVRKFIKVDLTEYNIKLTADETLAFANENDTILPAQVMTKGTVNDAGQKKYTPAKYMIDEWDVVGYYYYDYAIDSETGKPIGFTHTDNSLLFDFELERTYESESAYNAMVAAQQQADADYAAKLAAVKAAYGDKCFSLIGDSISTFNGVTNNAQTNATLSKNAVYYTINTTVYQASKTYWGKLAQDTGMDLCVINSWSGGTAYGLKGGDDMLTRSYNLATKNGTTPDVIFLYYGINDMNNSPSSINESSTGWRYSAEKTGDLAGDLYQRLTNTADTRTQKQIVAEWFEQVQAYATARGYNPNDPTTINLGTVKAIEETDIFITWEAAYALALQNMKRLYDDTEIFMLTLQPTNHSSGKEDRLDRANVILRALAEYFEVDLIDQANCEITKDNCHAYARDAYGLHPNGKGHAAITKLLVEALYEKLSK